MPEKQDIYSVSELTHYIKFLLEENDTLQGTWVSGEVSNLTKHSSGHVYFTLKDEGASLACVMFRGVASRYKILPESGEKLQVLGSITVYPPRGNYQIIVQAIKKSGLGDLHQRFLDLKDLLEKEGLFDDARKKPIPKFPKRIGVVTSTTGAVIRDIANTVRRRYPHVKISVAPATVQGESAAPSIISALALLQKLPDLDLIILARGGGSLEDLWCFNDEKLARAIANSNIPVISGVGHETDFTIADFVADRRASTPTAAAELAVPDIREVQDTLNASAGQIKRSLQHFIDYRRQVLDDYEYRLEQAVLNPIEYARGELEILATKLESFNVKKTLDRGYSITLKNRRAVSSVKNLKAGEKIETMFADGKTESTIETIIPND